MRVAAQLALRPLLKLDPHRGDVAANLAGNLGVANAGVFELAHLLELGFSPESGRIILVAHYFFSSAGRWLNCFLSSSFSARIFSSLLVASAWQPTRLSSAALRCCWRNPS